MILASVGQEGRDEGRGQLRLRFLRRGDRPAHRPVGRVGEEYVEDRPVWSLPNVIHVEIGEDSGRAGVGRKGIQVRWCPTMPWVWLFVADSDRSSGGWVDLAEPISLRLAAGGIAR